MTKFDKDKFKRKLKKKIKKQTGKRKSIQVNSSGPIYFFGAVGAAVYYISTAGDFWAGVVGILKAIVWPAFLVFEALSNLGS